MEYTIFYHKWVKPNSKRKLLKFDDVSTPAPKEQVKQEPVYFEFKDGVLTIPVYEDGVAIQIKSITVERKDYKYSIKVEWKDLWLPNHTTNQLNDTDPNEVVTFLSVNHFKLKDVIKLDLTDVYEWHKPSYLVKPVIQDTGFAFSFLDLPREEYNTEGVIKYLKKTRQMYGSKEDALTSLPMDIVIQVRLSYWDSREYNNEGYSVVKVVCEDKYKRDMYIHLTRRKS